MTHWLLTTGSVCLHLLKTTRHKPVFMDKKSSLTYSTLFTPPLHEWCHSLRAWSLGPLEERRGEERKLRKPAKDIGWPRMPGVLNYFTVLLWILIRTTPYVQYKCLKGRSILILMRMKGRFFRISWTVFGMVNYNWVPIRRQYVFHPNPQIVQQISLEFDG